MRFIDYARNYVESQKFRLAPSTVDNYRSYVNALVGTSIDTDIDAILRKHVDKTTEELTQKIKSLRRVSWIMMFANAIMRNAVEDDLAKKTYKPVKLKEPEKQFKPMDKAEVMRIIQHCDPHYQPWFRFLFYSGVRPSESYALRWMDVDLRAGEIVIWRGRVKGKEKDATKTSKVRKIPITEGVKNALADVSLDADSEYVFVTRYGQPRTKSLSTVWNKGVEAAGLPPRRSYELRHAFACKALSNPKMKIEQVSKLLGHANVNMTYRAYYANINSDIRDDLEQAQA